MNSVSTFRLMRSRVSAFMLAALVLPATLAFAQPTSPSAPAPADAPTAPKPPKSRSNITIIKDGEVVFSKSVDKNTMWRSLDDAINGELADSVKERVRTALKDAGKRVNISATGNTMTIVVDDENDKDGKNVVMSFSTDGVNRWGREFADTFRHHFNHDFGREFGREMRDVGREMRHFNFDASGLRDMAKRMRVMVAPHARAWNFNMDDEDDFTSEKAERLADEAKKMTREADALRKEADAMRLEAEAMKKRSEAVRLEAEARKKSAKTKDASETSKDAESAQSAKKKKQD